MGSLEARGIAEGGGGRCCCPDGVARFRARSRIARCEVRCNREKVLLVEIGYNLGH